MIFNVMVLLLCTYVCVCVRRHTQTYCNISVIVLFCQQFLCSDLARRVNDAYRNLRTATVDRGGVSQMPSLGGGATCLKHAQDTACSILSITETELEDIMSSDDGHVVDKVSGCLSRSPSYLFFSVTSHLHPRCCSISPACLFLS